MASSVTEWITEDESAKEMLGRVLTEKPFLLIPPLHRVPLRVGNVVEIVGPCPSAKTWILIQAAISCILPKDWNGVHYGGLESAVMFVDLECRFDILCLSQSLKCRIMEINGSIHTTNHEQRVGNISISKEPCNAYDEELLAACMRRFLHIRCYDSLEFLATFKTMHHQVQKEKEVHGTGVYLLMIDSIGAFNWIDRSSPSLPYGARKRKFFSVQNVMETLVLEIQKLLQVHPMLVLATKATTLGDRYSTNGFQRTLGKLSSQNIPDISSVRNNHQKHMHSECMPSVWKSFVTHRHLVRASEDDCWYQNHPVYLSEWLLPALSLSDKFVIKDAGVVIVY